MGGRGTRVPRGLKYFVVRFPRATRMSGHPRAPGVEIFFQFFSSASLASGHPRAPGVEMSSLVYIGTWVDSRGTRVPRGLKLAFL